uniref:Uncharacterized protein n=1 Tax=Varanus komodoensis TaxID=61221 RepID=A0A8D2KWJ0_VARKO
LSFIPTVFLQQINHLQQNTSEVLYHSLSERDLQIANWKQENEKLKKSYSLTAGLVTSLQKDITSKDQKIQQLKMDAEKFRRESREKDTQLAHVSAQIVDKIKQIQASNKEYIQRETLLREEIRAKDSEMEDVSGSIELLKKSLDGFQDFLKTSYCSSSLREEMCHLQALCLSPPASGVQASVCEVLCSLLRWVDAVERLLQDVGIDASDSEKGSLFLKTFCLFSHGDSLHHLLMGLPVLKPSELFMVLILSCRDFVVVR